MKHTLIIGGSRFLGPKLIENLQAQGHQVTVFNRGNDYGEQLPKDVTVIRGDRCKPEGLKEVFQTNFDFVYDMCCYDADDAKKLTRYVNASAHIVFFSTAAVYKKPTIYPLQESSALGEWNSFGNYGTNKAEAEDEFIRHVRDKGSKLTVFRPVYLLGENNYFDRENYYFSRIEKDLPILVPGNGNALIQFAFRDETAKAFAEIPNKQKSQIDILNIGGDEYVTLNGFIDLCADIVGSKPHVFGLLDKHIEDEQAFDDDLYPFPNLNFIVSNEKIKSYGFNFLSLRNGLDQIYKNWKQSWNGEVNISPKEKDTLKKMSS